MPRSPANTVTRSSEAELLQRVGSLATVGVIAAASAYLLHHAPPLANHALLPMTVAVGLATLAAVAAGRAAAARHHPALPIVVTAAGDQTEVRRAGRADLQFSASLHARALPHGFFVALGPGFLRAYYATFVDSPHAVALVASMQGHPVGALVGVLRPQAHLRRVLRRRGIRLVLLGAMALLSRPRSGWRFVRTRVAHYTGAWRRHRNTAEPKRSNRAAAVLSHVAVVPGARGAGVGSVLLSAFLEEIRIAGIERAVVTTLDGPDGAADFYRRHGWRDAGIRKDVDGICIRSFAIELKEAQQ